MLANFVYQTIYIKVSIIYYKIIILWITNFLDLRSILVLLLAIIKYKNFENSSTTNAFMHAITSINIIAIAPFFETIHIEIFNHLLVAGLNYGKFIYSVFIYFGIMKINNKKMLYFIISFEFVELIT